MSVNPDESKILDVLKDVKASGSSKNIFDDGIVKSVGQDNGNIVIEAALAGADRAAQLALEATIKTAVSKAGLAVDKIKIKFNAPASSSASQANTQGIPAARSLDNIKHIIAVGSGKGGVGKSTATLNLAASMALRGYKVGILDADIYGPSIGKMAGFSGKVDLKTVDGNRIIPLVKHGIKIMSFSFLIDPTQSVPWRGPMLGKALEQFLFDIEWGELDYLFIDLPPGTGDVQLSLAQLVIVEGAVIITTPQTVALFDAERAIDMFNKVNLPIIGIIENMSEFICPNCGQSSHIFSSNGGSDLATSSGAPLLGKIPLSPKIMESGEKGFPFSSVDPTGDVTPEMKKILDAFQTIVTNMENSLKE